MKNNHSTESALLKVHNDIIMSMDKGVVTALTLLDLSAAFDNIDHATLTDRRSDWYGISGQAHISSYLKKRYKSVKINTVLSDKVTLQYGDSQGSVLGPVYFTLCTTSLSAIILSYADDNKLVLQHCLIINGCVGLDDRVSTEA